MKASPEQATRLSIQKAVEGLLQTPEARKATVFQSPKLTVVATRREKADRRNAFVTLLLTIGKPNHANRRRIKTIQEAKEPFPVKKVRLEYWPTPKAKKATRKK